MYKKFAANQRIGGLCPIRIKPLLMRLFTVVLTICMHISVFAFGQKVSISRKDVSLSTVIKEIKRQSGYNFLYDAGAFFNAPKISVEAKNAEVAEVLDQCFDGLDLNYIIRDKYVIISKKVLAMESQSVLQQRTVIGRVVDEKREPLEGVTVRVAQSAAITTTDASGDFQLQIPSSQVTLAFSLLGFQPQEVSI